MAGVFGVFEHGVGSLVSAIKGVGVGLVDGAMSIVPGGRTRPKTWATAAAQRDGLPRWDPRSGTGPAEPRWGPQRHPVRGDEALA